MRALIVDDSRAMRAILGQHMQAFGFEVVQAGDGRGGLARLDESGGVAVALVDWNMPVMNGIEFIRAVRRRPEFDAMRLMMVTTETELANVALALAGGADEYVMKPFTRDVIAHKLATMGLPIA